MNKTRDEVTANVQMQFQDMAQQRDAASLGMWIFILTEFLFFGALFASYAIMRVLHPEAIVEAVKHNNVILGTIETAILLTSSLTMALAIHSSQHGAKERIVIFTLLTMLLGAVFLGIHGMEYWQHYKDKLLPGSDFAYEGPNANHVELIFYLYFVMTGFHMLHVAIGIIELGFIAVFANWGKYSRDYFTPVEMSGLYWHLVDIVWIFLFPLFYLAAKI